MISARIDRTANARRPKAMALHPRRTIRRSFAQKPRGRTPAIPRPLTEDKIISAACQAIARENALASATALADFEFVSLASEILEQQTWELMRDDRL